ncbi:MAG: WbqC family protein [Atopobiaceae bacterium]|nr:WbqC family protein [Atopobiaceae bacterium]
MKLAIMQPYYIPYIGYWQLIADADVFVIYDDVNYIKNGWINRNRILINGSPRYINLPVIGASPNKLINEISTNYDEKSKKKSLRMIDNAYRKAPQYEGVLSLFQEMINFEGDNLALFLEHSIRLFAKYMHMDTEILMSSDLDKDTSLRGQDKVIDICKRLSADEYVNTSAGSHLYSFEDFAAAGISLQFITTKIIEYTQFKNDFCPNLSILDVLMFNDVVAVESFLRSYDIATS